MGIGRSVSQETRHVEQSALPYDAPSNPRGELPLVRHPGRRPAVRNAAATQAAGERRWDIVRLKSDLDHEDYESV